MVLLQGQLRPVTVKRLVMQGTVEQRILGARRQLGVDNQAAATAAAVLADTSLMEDEAAACRPQKRRAHGGGTAPTAEGELENLRRMQRCEMLGAIFGVKLHAAKA